MSVLSVFPCDGLKGSVCAPASKSYTIRAVLCGLLADGKSRIMSPLISQDTLASFKAARMLGAFCEDIENGLEVQGISGQVRAPDQRIDTMNSGTTIRLCTAISSLAQKPVTLTGDDSVRSRPMAHLLEALAQLGVWTTSDMGRPPVTVCGPILGGKTEIAGNVSSQFISAIMMAAPYAMSDVEIVIKNGLKSRPYVDLTLDMLSRFGIEAENIGYDRFNIASGQTYRACEYTVEGDYSSAAFMLAAGAIMGEKVRVTNLFPKSLQADRKMVEILEDMGADVKVGGNHVTVSGSGRLLGVKVDLSDCPDLVPIVSALGAVCEGEVEIFNARHARVKECDRISAMACELSKMGAKVGERPDGLTIKGARIRGARLSGWNDHRIIMSLAIAGLAAEGVTRIDGANHIDVTFPDFVNVMGRLGADMRMD